MISVETAEYKIIKAAQKVAKKFQAWNISTFDSPEIKARNRFEFINAARILYIKCEKYKKGKL